MKQKPTLYIIHGWTYTVAPWEKTISLLEKQGLKVIMLNVPGLTASSKKVWTIEEYVRWADRNIPDGAVALGHSNGGRILLNLCSEKPNKLKHLILLDSAGVYETSKSRDTARNLSKTFGFLKKVPGLTKIWHKLTGASDYARAPENMKKTLTNMLNSDKKLDIAKVTTPTSILWGREDTITPPRQGEAIHERIAGSTWEIHDGWTHAPYISHPSELAKAIFRVYKHPPERPAPQPVTQASVISASMALKKAAEPEIPSTAKISATLAFKKASEPSAEDSVSRSASLSVPSTKPRTIAENKRPEPPKEPESLLTSLQDVDYEQSDFSLPPRQIISTASVPKVSRKEKVRRKFQKTATRTKNTKKPQTPKTTKGAKQ